MIGPALRVEVRLQAVLGVGLDVARVERSKPTPSCSSPASGSVRPARSSCSAGAPVSGSSPSRYARNSPASRPMTGCGTNTRRMPGMPPTLQTERTTRANVRVCSDTVGSPYALSSVIANCAIAGAQVLQCPTPRSAASPRARRSSHTSLKSLR